MREQIASPNAGRGVDFTYDGSKIAMDNKPQASVLSTAQSIGQLRRRCNDSIDVERHAYC